MSTNVLLFYNENKKRLTTRAFAECCRYAHAFSNNFDDVVLTIIPTRHTAHALRDLYWVRHIKIANFRHNFCVKKSNAIEWR